MDSAHEADLSTVPVSLGSATENKQMVTPQGVIQSVWTFLNRKEIKFILIIFLLAFGVRAQLMRYELFFEFDSYWHARMVSYVIQGQGIPTVDPLGYYHNPVAAAFSSPPVLFWYISAAIYKLFTFNAPYDFELWVLFVKILPALYGALISVGMFFLGKELFKGPHENEAGLFAGLFAAIVPAFVYRTMGGFFEDDSLGFIWMVIGLVFYLRATHHPEWKKENWINALFAGIAFALMVFTWSAFNLLLTIFLGIGFLHFFLLLKSGELQKAKHLAGLWLLIFGIFAVAATLNTGLGWLAQFGTLSTIFKVRLDAPLVAAAVILITFAIAAIAWYAQKKKTIGLQINRWIYILAILFFVFSPLLVGIFNISLRTSDVLGQTVGEESDGKNYFGNKYSMLIIFAIIGIPAMGFLLLRRTKDFSPLIVALVWLVITFFMAWGKLKFTYYWGLPLALTGAVVLVLGLKWMRGHSLLTKKAITLGMGFMILCGVAAGTLFVTQNVPNIESSPGWKEALFWANKNLPQEAAFFNWWDEGHWASFLANRKVIIDNRNADTQATSDVAQFVLAQSEEQGYALVSKYQGTHLLFGDDLLDKLANLGFFAYNVTNPSDPRLQGLFGRVFNCEKKVATLTREVTFSCGGNNFTPQQMESIPTQWREAPNQLDNGTPLNVYREEDNSKLYAFSQTSNKSLLVRLWMHDPAITKFKEIYRNSGGVRIYEVIYPVIINPPSEVIPIENPPINSSSDGNTV